MSEYYLRVSTAIEHVPLCKLSVLCWSDVYGDFVLCAACPPTDHLTLRTDSIFLPKDFYEAHPTLVRDKSAVLCIESNSPSTFRAHVNHC